MARGDRAISNLQKMGRREGGGNPPKGEDTLSSSFFWKLRRILKNIPFRYRHGDEIFFLQNHIEMGETEG